MIKYIEFNEQEQIVKIVGICKAKDFQNGRKTRLQTRN